MRKERFIIKDVVDGCLTPDGHFLCRFAKQRTNEKGEYVKGICSVAGKSGGVYGTKEFFLKDMPLLLRTFEENSGGITETCPHWKNRETWGGK